MSTGPTKPHVLVIQPFGHLFPRTRRIIFHLSAWPRNLKKKKILGRKKKKSKRLIHEEGEEPKWRSKDTSCSVKPVPD